MPELPEVETIRIGLARALQSRRIEGVESSGARLRKPYGPEPLEHLDGRRFAQFTRHGKHLHIGLDDGSTLTIHLGMTGKLLVEEAGTPSLPHTHLELHLDDGTALRFSDPRRFGFLRYHGPGVAPDDLDHYGPDALSPTWTPDQLAASLKGSKAPLKAFLLDQTKVAGVGNIYACEALWRAGLSPRRRACNTPRSRVALLHESILAVLRDSLAAGGTSFNDYVNSIGEKGSFLFDVAVFQREGLPCPGCQTPVRRIVQSGRSTFYCPACQR